MCDNCKAKWSFKHGIYKVARNGVTQEVCSKCVDQFKRFGWVVIWSRFEE